MGLVFCALLRLIGLAAPTSIVGNDCCACAIAAPAIIKADKAIKVTEDTQYREGISGSLAMLCYNIF
jgi:hypothetical protein